MKKSYKAYRNSNYFSRDNYPDEPVTIEEVREERIAPPGGKEKDKLVAYFEGHNLGLILNSTKGAVLEEISGSEDPKDWPGVTIQIFFDPGIKFGQEVKGGLAIRPVKKAKEKPHRPVKLEEPESDDDEIPY